MTNLDRLSDDEPLLFAGLEEILRKFDSAARSIPEIMEVFCDRGGDIIIDTNDIGEIPEILRLFYDLKNRFPIFSIGWNYHLSQPKYIPDLNLIGLGGDYYIRKNESDWQLLIDHEKADGEQATAMNVTLKDFLVNLALQSLFSHELDLQGMGRDNFLKHPFDVWSGSENNSSFQFKWRKGILFNTGFSYSIPLGFESAEALESVQKLSDQNDYIFRLGTD